MLDIHMSVLLYVHMRISLALYHPLASSLSPYLIFSHRLSHPPSRALTQTHTRMQTHTHTHACMHTLQFAADIQKLDRQEKMRVLEKTNYQPKDQSHIEFMKNEFKRRWALVTTKLTATRHVPSKKVEVTKKENAN